MWNYRKLIRLLMTKSLLSNLLMIVPQMTIPLLSKPLMTGPLLSESPTTGSELLGNYTYGLYSCIRDHIMTNHQWIVDHFDHTMGRDNSDMELLLVIIAMELHSGRTSSFYGMLEFMKNKRDYWHLAVEIQEEVAFDVLAAGMYTSSYTHYYCHTYTQSNRYCHCK